MSSASEELTWHDGATVEGISAPARKAPKPHAGAREPLSDEVRSIPALVAQKNTSGDLERFKTRVSVLPTADTQTLITRIAVTDDALMLWAIHLALDKRGIAPALRWPPNTDNPQNEFITFAADLHWFAKRNPVHRPRFRGWAGVFRHLPASPAWHATTHRQYLFVAPRYSLAYMCSKGLALSERQRLEFMMLPTNAMQAERRQLHADKFAELRAQLLTHAVANRDKSGVRQPHDVANRRAALWRTHLLTGRSCAATAQNWHLLTGETTPKTGRPVTRQALDKQLSIVEDVMRGRQ